MSASVRAILDGLRNISTLAIRMVTGGLLTMLAAFLIAAPAAAQSITGSSVSPSTYSGAGQTITFTVTVNSGSKVASSATVTSQIGAVYSCPIADTVNTGVTFTCTATYSTTATDVASLQVQERPDVRLLSFATPTIMTGPILTANFVAPPSPPTVTSISPTTGPTTGGTTVTITGTNFAGATAVTFGATAATGFTVNSATQITATAPAGSAGTVDVRVTTGAGTSATSAADQYTYAAAAVAPSVTTNPSSTNVIAGNTATFTAAASGTPAPTVQWQVSSDGGATFGNIAGATSTTLSFTSAAGDNGKRYRAVFTNASGTATTTAATLNILTLPVITTQPVGGTVAPGQGITMSAAATGTPPPSVAWLYSEDNGANFVTITTATTFSLVSPTPKVVLLKAVFTNAAGSVTSDTVTLTWVKQNQTISFTSTAPSAASVGGATYSPAATASSGLAVSFTIDASASSVCSVSGGTVSFIGAGTCTINANQAGNTTYNAAPQVQQSFTVGQGANVITFPPLSDTPFASAPPALSATASSGLAVSYASNSTGVCTVAGGTISFVGGGTCSITASQAGNASYVAATPVTQTFAVTQTPNNITFPVLSDTPFTSTPPALSATASSGLAVSYASNSAGVCTVSGGAISFVSTGTCSVTASQAGNATYQAATPVTQTFAVTLGANTITFAPMADTPFTSAPPVPSATASSGLTVSYASTTTGVCTTSSTGAISFVAAGTCTITASQGGDANYAAAAPVDQSFAVTPGVNTITFAPLPSRALASGSFALTATASSGLAVSYASTTPATCSVSGSTVALLAVGTCSVTASQPGNGSFAAATPVSQSFAITRAVSTVALTSSASTVFFGQPVTLTATVGGVSPTGTVTFTDGATALGTVALSGSTASFTSTTLSAGAHSFTATYNGDASNDVSTSTAVTVTVNARPDPSADPDVRSSTDQQFRQTQRFVRSQIDNIGGRLDQLHTEGDNRGGMAVRISQVRPRLASALPFGTAPALAPNEADPMAGAAMGASPAAQPVGTVAAEAAAASAAGFTPDEAPRWSIWASGDVSFGKQQPSGQVETSFTSQGLTVGMDGRFSDNLKLGAAFGFGWDNSRIGTNGSENDASNASLAFYGSWRAAPQFYIDGIVGLGYGNINTTRYSVTGAVFLDGKRRTSQTFAALIATWEGHLGSIEFAPYLRADGIWVHLSPYTETGSTTWALAFQAADENSFSGVAGARLRFPLGGGWKLVGKGEYRTRLSGDYTQLLGYADLQGIQGSPYAITGSGVDESTFTGGLGLEGRLRQATIRLNYDLTTMSGGNIANRFSGALIVPF